MLFFKLVLILTNKKKTFEDLAFFNKKKRVLKAKLLMLEKPKVLPSQMPKK